MRVNLVRYNLSYLYLFPSSELVYIAQNGIPQTIDSNWEWIRFYRLYQMCMIRAKWPIFLHNSTFCSLKFYAISVLMLTKYGSRVFFFLNNEVFKIILLLKDTVYQTILWRSLKLIIKTVYTTNTTKKFSTSIFETLTQKKMMKKWNKNEEKKLKKLFIRSCPKTAIPINRSWSVTN